MLLPHVVQRETSVRAIVKLAGQHCNMLDSRIKIALDTERDRQSNTVELIASENYTSQEVMDLCGSILTKKMISILRNEVIE